MIANEHGFTLVEILVSLAIFAVVVVGALGVLGAAGSGGFLEGFPTGFVTTRAARDTTAAAVYLQAFHEYAAARGGAALTPGTYCQGSGCATQNLSSAGLGVYPTPPGYPYQLSWQRLDVVIDQWYPCFDSSTPPKFLRYSVSPGVGCTVDTTKEYLVHINSKLTWQFRGTTRTMTVDRFLP